MPKHDRAQPSPDVRVGRLEDPLDPHRADPEEPCPAREIDVDRVDDRFQRSPTRSWRQLSDSLTKPLLAALREQHLGRTTFLGTKAEPEKMPGLGTRHGALRLVHLEAQAPLDERDDAVHDTLPCTFAPYVDVAVIGVADESKPPPRELVVELAQHDVREQRR